MAVQVFVNGVDVSALHLTKSFAIKNTGLGIVVADCSFNDIAGTASINLEHVLRVLDGGVEIFEGPIRWREREAISDPVSVALAKKSYAVKAQDFTSYLADDVIDVATVRTGSRTDKAEVEFLVTTFSTKGIIGGTPVVSTGTISRDIDYTGMNLYEALEEASKWLGTKFYVDSGLTLHWFVAETASSSFNLSDAPNGTTTFGYRRLRLQDDSGDYANSVFVVGTGISGWRPNPPVAGASRRAMVLRDSGVTTQAQLDAAGDAALVKYGIVGPITLETFQPGLKAGNTIQLTNALWGISAVTYNIVEVSTGYLEGTNTLVYRLTLNSRQPDLGSILSNTQQQTTVVQSDIPTAQSIAVDLTTGGANLIPNSSFEDGTSWAVGANWVIGYNPGTGLAFQGNKEARATLAAATAGPLTTPKIKVVRTDDYWFSVYTWIRSWTSGAGLRIKVLEYNAANALVATTVIATLTAAQSNWTRQQKRFGGNAQNGRTAFNAATTQVAIEFDTSGATTATMSVDGVQWERGMLLTAYAPAPYELADGAITTTKIADDAITSPKVTAGAIVAGKIAANAVTAGTIAANAVTAAAIAAGTITADKLAATLILASLIKTADTGKRVEIDDDGIRLLDAAEGLLVRIPTNTDPVYVSGQVEASSLVSTLSAELRGASTLTAGATMIAQVGVTDPSSAPAIVQSVPSMTLSPAPSQLGSGICYDPAGDAGGATPTYWVGANPEVGNLLDLAYEYRASDGVLLRTLQKTGTTTTNTTTLGSTSHVSDSAAGFDGANLNHAATPLTMPRAGRITKVSAYWAGHNGSCAGRNAIWDDVSGTGHMVAQSNSVTISSGGATGLGNSDLHTLSMITPYSAAAGETIYAGFYHSASGEGFQFDRDDGSGKTTYMGDGASDVDGTGWSVFDSSGKPNVYITYDYDVNSALEGTVGTIIGVARQGTFIWVLDDAAWLYKYNQSDLSYVTKYSMSAPLWDPANAGLFFDGTNLVLVSGNDGTTSGPLRFSKVSTAGVVGTIASSTGFTYNPVATTARGGYFDGTNYWVAFYGTTNGVYAFNATTLANVTSRDFGLSAEIASGITWNGTQFVGFSGLNSGKVWKFTGWDWTTASPIYWVSYAWYDITGTVHESNVSPRTSITMGRRRQLQVTTPAIPAGGTEPVDRVRVYMVANATDPGGTGYKLQATDTLTARTFQTYLSAGAANPGANNFPVGTPAEIKSVANGPGWSLKGDGSALFDGLPPALALAAGVLIQTGTMGVTTAGGVGGNATLTFPTPFSAPPVVTVAVNGTNTDATQSTFVDSVVAASCRVSVKTTTNFGWTVRWMAIGPA